MLLGDVTAIALLEDNLFYAHGARDAVDGTLGSRHCVGMVACSRTEERLAWIEDAEAGLQVLIESHIHRAWSRSLRGCSG